MKGAIFYSSQYGSTAQYAQWVCDATGLPLFDTNTIGADPSEYDYLILGSSVIVGKLTIRKWVKDKLSNIADKPIILFTVSSSGAGPNLNSWIKESLPGEITSNMEHVALRGRMHPDKLSWILKIALKIGAVVSKGTKTPTQELNGFDYMDKSSIKPIVEIAKKYQSSNYIASMQPASKKIY